MLVEDERRRLCEQCRRKKMSAVERQRRANQLSYVANRDQRLAQRKERRKLEGAAIREAERARYAAKKGGQVRPYKRKGAPTWETPATP